MNRLITLLLAIPMILLFAQAEDKDTYVPGEVMIQFEAGAKPANLSKNYRELGVENLRLLSDDMNIYLYQYDQSKIADSEILSRLRQDPSVKAVQFNHYVKYRHAVTEAYIDNIREFVGASMEAVPNDPRFNEQWALRNTGQSGGVAGADIKATQAWDITKGGVTALGDTIVVAIMEGMQLDHPDLDYWINWGEIPGNGIDDDGNGYIDDVRGWNAATNNGNIATSSHGTHVAGIAGAKGNNGVGVAGVNWFVKTMPVLALSTSLNEATVVAAYGYVLKMRKLYNQTNGQKGAFIVTTNASFGVDNGQPANYPLWCAIYDSMGVQGILSCGATANANWNIDITGDIPTACPSPYMVAVTNTTSSDLKNSGAAYGLTTIDLGAPGTSILSTESGSTYSLKTGTSMATPTVAGGIALVFAGANAGLMQAYKQNPAQGALILRDFIFNNVDPLPDLAGKTVTGGRLNVYKALLAVSTPPDTVPPTTITNLNITSVTSNSATISWTVPLDTTRNGVVAYDIRMSTSPIIDETTFNNATPVPFNGAPSAAGATDQVTVTGLNFATNYYFSIKASDLWGNVSQMSNVATGTTWGAPVLSVTPDSMYHNFSLPNMTIVDTIFISNSSAHNSTLNYQFSFENHQFPQNKVPQVTVVPIHNAEEYIGTKDNPSVYYNGSIEGFGGPDAFGYKWIDSDEPNGPQYVWEEISATGTLAANWTATSTWTAKDEGYAGPYPLGFNYKFYGQSYSQVYINANGFLHFLPMTTSILTNPAIPNAAAPNAFIAGFFDDLDGSTQGNVYYKADADKFIVQFDNWKKYANTSSLTFQMIMYRGGKVMVYYKSMAGTLNSATVGIENHTGTVGLQVVRDANYVKNNHAIKFAAEPDWITSTTPASGTIHNNNSVAVILTMRSEDFPVGSYAMDLKVTSNDPNSTVKMIPIIMENGVVPVELSAFSAEASRNNVNLSWTTATEVNNSGFVVERQGNNGNWSELTFISGRGNSTEINNYSYIDNNLNAGSYTYRLKQIDYDGTFEYSNSIEVNVSVPDQYALFQNYPNPFNPSTVIEFSLPENAEVTLEVYSMLGELLASVTSGMVEAGYHKYNFDAASLTSGTYIYRLTAKGSANNFTQTKKMVVLK
jgi:hypothetical protein